MPGFFISNFNNDFILNNCYENKCIQGEIINEKFIIKRNTLNKFLDDKLLCESHNYIIITEGVILNKVNLIKKYGKDDFEQTIIEMITKKGQVFFSEFTGSFSGAVYDKKNATWTIYTNQTGDKAVFYYVNKEGWMVGSQSNYIIEALKKISKNCTLDEQAVYYMLTYGFMADNRTYANEIKRLNPGTYLTVTNGIYDVKTYYQLKKGRYDLSQWSESKIIDMIDVKFIEAVKLQYEKDVEYGYKHISDLSGGLDSRMDNWVASQLGFKDILNINYGQANQADELISKHIANCLGHEIICKPLDECSFMFDIDEIVRMNFGLGVYSGITGGKRMLDIIDFDKYGCEHTGMLGDVIIGSYLEKTRELKETKISGMYSKLLISRVKKQNNLEYEDSEIYKISVRGFLGILSTLMIRQNYTEVLSPFLMPDFMEFCFSISEEKRIGHYIYKKWIITKYPEAAAFIWEKTGCRITKRKNVKHDMFNLLKKVYNKCPQNLKTKIKGNYKQGMNPLDIWYKKNNNMQSYFSGYFNTHINAKVIPDNLEADLSKLFNQGTVGEMAQVLTALSAIKLYFNC